LCLKVVVWLICINAVAKQRDAITLLLFHFHSTQLPSRPFSGVARIYQNVLTTGETNSFSGKTVFHFLNFIQANVYCHCLYLQKEITFSTEMFAECCSILQTGHTTHSSTPDQQRENRSTKYHRQQPLYNTLELLMMGIMVLQHPAKKDT